MNMNEKDIDHLTRKLMRGTAEQPSASLNSRIMALFVAYSLLFGGMLGGRDLSDH